MPWTVNQRAFVQQSLSRVQSPMPGGLYTCEVADSKCSTDNYGRPVLRLHLRVIDGRQLGKKLFFDLRFTPQTVRATKAFLLSCGIKKYNQLVDGVLRGLELVAEVQPYTTQDFRDTNIVVGVALVMNDV